MYTLDSFCTLGMASFMTIVGDMKKLLIVERTVLLQC